MNKNAAPPTPDATAHTVWAVTDGRAGNEAQAMGLAQALARISPGEWRVEVKRIGLRAPFHLLPPRLWAALGAREGSWPFWALEDRGATLARPWPDAVIGTGRRSAPIVAAMRRIARAGGERLVAAQILDPQMALSAFDLVIAPEHDGLTAPNALSTLGAVNRLTPERIAEEATRWRDRLSHLPSPRVAVLLGGPSKSAVWREEDVDRFCAQMAALSREAGLMVTPSRRTDPVVLAALQADCQAERCWIWDGAGDNPYPGILGLADAVIVTEDSVNMASEAASTGLPVHVFRISGLDEKLRRFHDALSARGAARSFEGRLERWNYTPLAETDRAAARLAELVAEGSGADSLGTGAQGA
jgi:mitochondrial fission protein ELM1